LEERGGVLLSEDVVVVVVEPVATAGVWWCRMGERGGEREGEGEREPRCESRARPRSNLFVTVSTGRKTNGQGVDVHRDRDLEVNLDPFLDFTAVLLGTLPEGKRIAPVLHDKPLAFLPLLGVFTLCFRCPTALMLVVVRPTRGGPRATPGLLLGQDLVVLAPQLGDDHAFCVESY